MQCGERENKNECGNNEELKEITTPKFPRGCRGPTPGAGFLAAPTSLGNLAANIEPFCSLILIAIRSKFRYKIYHVTKGIPLGDVSSRDIAENTPLPTVAKYTRRNNRPLKEMRSCNRMIYRNTQHQDFSSKPRGV